MRSKQRLQFRLASLLWIMLVVCAFFCGYRWRPTGSDSSTGTAAKTAGLPLGINFAVPTLDEKNGTATSESFSFFIGISH